ncbi:MAG: hypothetical protein KJ070_09660 [Verrucomicrobia bacterium]|nr:hypothetical protein [Verrucomicrobiota bacterium]
MPHLRNLYQKTGLNRTKGSPATGTNSLSGFGFTHDGEFQDLFTFLSIPAFGVFQNDTVRKTNLQAFLLCFDTGTAPAVGYGRTVRAANVHTPGISNDWSLLEAQAAVRTNIDLIVKGTIDGIHRGLLYQPVANHYQLDSTNGAPLTRTELVAKVQAGDTLTFLGVPPGAGSRMGLDRDGDGVLDADTPLPSLQINHSNGQTVLRWPFGAAGFRLEESVAVGAGDWNAVTNPVEIVNGFNQVATPPAESARFFRLRMPAAAAIGQAQ